MSQYDKQVYRTCSECGKHLKNISGHASICKHINTKRHQKNKLINDNKCYNTLISLVRSNLPNDLLGLINDKVINNYENEKPNIIKSQENYELKDKLLRRYIPKRYDMILEDRMTYSKPTNIERQICYNTTIQKRLGLGIDCDSDIDSDNDLDIDDIPIQTLIDNNISIS